VRYLLVAASLGCGLGCVSQSRAAGFATARFGGEHGNVTAVNPTALYFNPGAIAESDGIRLYLDGTLALRRLTWRHPPAGEAPDPPGGAGANAGRADALNVFGAPMFGVTLSLGNFAIGAGAYVPFGGRLRWSENDDFAGRSTYPLAADGVQRWHSIEGSLTYVYGTLAVAYRVGRFSVGASANLISSSVVSKKAKNLTGNGDPDTAHEGRISLDVSGVQGSFGLGALFEALADRLWLGASYQAQPGVGPMQLRGTLALDYDGSSVSFPVTFDQALPDIARAGVRFRPLPVVELRLFGDFTRWSVLQTQCVAVEGHPCLVDASGADAGDGGVLLNLRRKWQDTFGVRVGASHWPWPSLELFVGSGFETSAVPDATLDPELADSQTISGALGARVELPAKWFIGASLTHLFFLERDNTGKSELMRAGLPTRRADGGGRYTQGVSILDANLEKHF
jgi:long-chain fatty acid transport protein